MPEKDACDSSEIKYSGNSFDKIRAVCEPDYAFSGNLHYSPFISLDIHYPPEQMSPGELQLLTAL